ncbi:MAG: type IV pilus assembly protein PilM [Actinomycetota bacterium]
MARYVGLDVGTHAVRAAELSVGRDGIPTLERFGQVALPAGAVVAGEVAEPTIVSQALKRLWREVGFSTKKVIIGVGNQRVVVRPDELPEMDDDELRQAIEFKADELIPIPLEDAVLDFQELERDVNEDGEPIVRVLVVAAQRDMLNTLMEALQGADLTVEMVDLMPFGLVRSLADTDLGSIDDSGPIADAIVAIGAGVTTVVVHELGVPRFIRLLTLGAETVTEGLAREFEIDVDGAEGIKRQLIAGQLDHAEQTRANSVVTDRIGPLVDEIRSSLDYHMAHESSSLRRVLLTGGGARLPRIADHLRTQLDTEVVTADPLGRIRVGNTGLSERQLLDVADLAAVPIGLALAGRPAAGGVRRLDLQPPEVARRKAARRQAVLVGAGVVVLIGALGALWVRRGDQVSQAEAEAERLEAQVAQVQAEIGAFGAVQALEAELGTRQELIRTALRNDVAWTKLIQEVATVMPDDTWMSSFQATAPTDTTAGTFVVAGNGFDHTSSARWLLRLDPLPGVSSMWIPTSTRTIDEETGDGEAAFASQAVLAPAALSDRVEDYLGTFPGGGRLTETSAATDAEATNEEGSQ